MEGAASEGGGVVPPIPPVEPPPGAVPPNGEAAAAMDVAAAAAAIDADGDEAGLDANPTEPELRFLHAVPPLTELVAQTVARNIHLLDKVVWLPDHLVAGILRAVRDRSGSGLTDTQ